MKFKRLLLLFLFAFPIVLFAQHPHYVWRNYSTDDGLPSSEVHYALQTPDGFMWFATDNGLSRFDGYEFVNFSLQEGLENPVVFYLQLDPEGKLWVATSSGQVFGIQDNIIEPFPQNHVIQSSLDSALIKAIVDFKIDASGRFLLSLNTLGVLEIFPGRDPVLYQPLDSSIRIYSRRYEDDWITVSNPLASSLPLGEVWVGSNQLTWQFSDSTANQTIMVVPGQPTGSNYLWSKKLKSGHQLCFVRRWLMLTDDQHQIVWSYEFGHDLPVKSLFQRSDGAILMGVLQGQGIYFYENEAQLQHEPAYKDLPGRSVSHIFQDRQGGIWVTTINHGIYYCPNPELLVYDEISGLPTNQITSIEPKNKEEIFIGTKEGSILLLNTKTVELNLLPRAPNTSTIYDLIYVDVDNTLWASTKRHGYFSQGKWKTVLDLSKKGNYQAVIGKNLSLSRDSTLLWGGNTSNFGAIDVINKKIAFNSLDIGVNGRIYSVCHSASDTIYIGNPEGLFYLNNDQLHRPEPFHPIYATRMDDIAEMPDGTLVMATKGQGVLLKQGGKVLQIDKSHGLTSNMIENLYVDQSSSIWAGTLNGLNKIRVTPKGISVQPFTKSNGFPSNEINQVKVNGDTVWVATFMGLVRFEDRQKSDTLSGPPVLNKVVVNGSSIDHLDQNEFSYRKNDLIFHFLTVNYPQQSRIPYRYRLAPGQKNWQYTRQRQVNFSSLNNGKYRFEVQSQNEYGRWSPITQYTFEIHPPFYSTYWFILINAGLIGIIGYLFYRRRVAQLQEETKIARKIADLERSALIAQMNPHFIFNCLNAISTFVYKGDRQSANKYLSTFSTLLRGVLSHSRSKVISIEEELELLRNYMKMEQLRANNSFDFSIELSPNLEVFDLDIPSMLIQPFVENAIIHGLSKKTGKGQLNVLFEEVNGYLRISIKDNGIGINQSKKAKKTHTGLHRSFGMEITKQRLELIRSGSKTGNFEAIELTNPDGTVSGTKVLVWIPLPNESL